MYMTETSYTYIYIDRCNNNPSPLIGISCVNFDKTTYMYSYTYIYAIVCACVCVLQRMRVCAYV